MLDATLNDIVINFTSLIKVGPESARSTLSGNASATVSDIAGCSIIVPVQALSNTSNAVFLTSSDQGVTWQAASQPSTLTVDNYYALAQSELELQADLQLAAGSVIAAGSQIAGGSKINKFAYSSHMVKDGQEYKLQASEKVYIVNSSGVVLKEFGVDEWILTKNLDLVVNGAFSTPTTTVTGQVLQSTQSISKLIEDQSVVGAEYFYLLSLNRAQGEVNLGAEYTLEEGEMLVYAPQNLVEYVTLGPGTVLSAENDLVLQNTPITSITELSDELFSAVPQIVYAQATELTTYLAPMNFEHNLSNEGPVEDTTTFPVTWVNLGGHQLTVYDEEHNSVLSLIDESANSIYDVRLAVKLQSDISGELVIAPPVVVKLQTSSGVSTLGLSSSVNIPMLLTSFPFVAVLSQSSTDAATAPTLLPAGVSAVLNYAVIQVPQSTTGLDVVRGVDSITITVGEGLQVSEYSFNLLSLPTVSKILATMIVKYPESTVGEGFIGLETGGGDAVFMSAATAVEPVAINPVSVRAGGATVSLPFTPPAEGTGTVTVTVTFPADAASMPVGTVIEIKDISYVLSFSDELAYETQDSGESVPVSSLDYYSTALDENLITAIREADTLHVFNWLCTPKEELAHPTKSSSYFNIKHSLNSKTLPYLEFDSSAVKIVRGR